MNLTGKGNDKLEDWNTEGKDQWKLKILPEGIAVPTPEIQKQAFMSPSQVRICLNEQISVLVWGSVGC